MDDSHFLDAFSSLGSQDAALLFSLLFLLFLKDFLFVLFCFLMWTNFKVFIEFVTILLLFYVLVFWARGIRHLSSQARDRTHTPCIGRRSLNHWTAREVTPCFLSVLVGPSFLSGLLVLLL